MEAFGARMQALCSGFEDYSGGPIFIPTAAVPASIKFRYLIKSTIK
jgi:hypothetical protein